LEHVRSEPPLDLHAPGAIQAKPPYNATFVPVSSIRPIKIPGKGEKARAFLFYKTAFSGYFNWASSPKETSFRKQTSSFWTASIDKA
jgi:hypothetical protein